MPPGCCGASCLAASSMRRCSPRLSPATPRTEFEVFHAMIYYIDQFPERLHHPKEDRYLFARVAERAPQAKRLIEDLRAEHVLGAQLVRDLEQALIGLEVGWPGGGAGFR